MAGDVWQLCEDGRGRGGSWLLGTPVTCSTSYALHVDLEPRTGNTGFRVVLRSASGGGLDRVPGSR
jgi:hypothetical protein